VKTCRRRRISRWWEREREKEREKEERREGETGRERERTGGERRRGKWRVFGGRLEEHLKVEQGSDRRNSPGEKAGMAPEG
jgi:hypothetical protein